MEEILLNLLKQTPGLAVAVGIVVIFVRHLGKKDEQFQAISARCHEIQQEGHQIMRDVSRSMGEVTVALSNLNGKKR